MYVKLIDALDPLYYGITLILEKDLFKYSNGMSFSTNKEDLSKNRLWIDFFKSTFSLEVIFEVKINQATF